MSTAIFRSAICKACRWSTVQIRRTYFSVNGSPRSTSQGNKVRIVEVGSRDGLQNEKTAIPLATKMELIQRLLRSGVTNIEVGSFVAPKWVSQVCSIIVHAAMNIQTDKHVGGYGQMANSSEILERLLKGEIKALNPVSYSFLTPNMKGFSNAAKVLEKIKGGFSTQMEPIFGDEVLTKPTVEVAVLAAATESFSQRNLNCDIKTSVEQFRPVIRDAKALGLRVRAYISVVLGCPFEGFDVDTRRVAEIAIELLKSGADEISLGDTTGMGTAPRTGALLQCLTAAGLRNEDIAVHFHDTYGQALVNLAVALEHGIRTVDSSVGGLGGCPYSPGATGNVATENVVYFLETLGMDTGIDLDAMADAGAWITAKLAKENDSVVGKAVLGARMRANEVKASGFASTDELHRMRDGRK